VNIYECTVRELRRTTFDMLSRVHKARLRNRARRPGKRK
jgi:hypothetical protein